MAGTWRRERRWARETREVAVALGREWRDDRVTGLAAEMAFFGLLSLFPVLLVVAAALGSLEGIVGGEVAARAEREVLSFLERVLSDEAAGAVSTVERLFRDTDAGILTFGVVIALWSASRGFVAAINALDVVYDIEERRNYVVLRLAGLLLGLGTAVVVTVVLAMLVLGPLLGTGQEIADALGVGGGFATFWDWFRWPTVVALMILWAGTIFHVAPNRRTPWRWDLPGAVLTAALWGLLSLGFRLYLGVAGEGNEVLSALGGSLIVILWLYLMGIGLLTGGELNAVLAARRGVPQLRRDRLAILRRRPRGRSEEAKP